MVHYIIPLNAVYRSRVVSSRGTGRSRRRKRNEEHYTRALCGAEAMEGAGHPNIEFFMGLSDRGPLPPGLCGRCEAIATGRR